MQGCRVVQVVIVLVGKVRVGCQDLGQVDEETVWTFSDDGRWVKCREGLGLMARVFCG